jgi:hypothetical protein
MKPGNEGINPKKPKYHFEGTKTNEDGETIYVVVKLKTGKVLEWSEKLFKKNKSQIEY